MLDGHSLGAVARVHPSKVPLESAPVARQKVSRVSGVSPDNRQLPFVERRHKVSITESWPAALDALHRHLLGLEDAKRSLEESENKFREIFKSTPLGLFQMDADGQLLNLNDAMAKILGFDAAEEVLKTTVTEDFSLLFPKSIAEMMTEAAETSCFDFQIANTEGMEKWIRVHLKIVNRDAEIGHVQGTAEDITAIKQAETRTRVLAYYDRLTGLPNRILFIDRLGELMLTARERKRTVAVLLIEIDRFRVINDSLGEDFGNQLLQETAAYIRSKVGEKCLVARVGSAEFAVALPVVPGTDRVEAIARSLVTGLGVEHALLGHSLNVCCNIGISAFPDHGDDPETLIKNADVAQCFARENSENRCRVFTTEMNDKMTERFLLDHGLRRALSQNELYLEYQPQVDIRSGAIIGMEALLRWMHPQMGLISPNRFIAIAENNGLIVPIGEWVLRTACAQARAWQDRGSLAVPVAVNVSAIQFRQQDFCGTVRKILTETGLDPRYLELELTESLLLANADVTSQVTTELREMGVKLAIDDFGTGYSNLGYLKHFKVNRLKIDRSFIRDVALNADDAAIAVAIIGMAQALNLSVLAEGVEDPAQLEFLKDHGCYTAQGYYFARPATVEQIDEELKSGKRQLLPQAK